MHHNMFTKIKQFFKKAWKWIITLIVGGVVLANLGTIPPEEPAGATDYFAEVDGEGTVLRVIVISQEMINTGKWGDPKNWIQTYHDGSKRKNYAGTGYKYDKTRDAFIPPKLFDSWTLDEASLRWVPPVAYPSDSNPYIWDEAITNWKIMQ